MLVLILAWPHLTLSNSGQSASSVERENSSPSTGSLFSSLNHLPIVEDRVVARHTHFAKAQGRARVEQVLVGSYGSGYCVALARAKSGLEIYGNARDWPILAKNAGYRVDYQSEPGAVIVTSESSAGTNTGHVLYQTGEVDDGYIPVVEQNYVSRKVTRGWLSADSPVIVAFIHKT